MAGSASGGTDRGELLAYFALTLCFAVFLVATHTTPPKLPATPVLAEPTAGLQAPTSTTTGAVPATQFVTRVGSRLILAGHPFRFSGSNIYWPALTDLGGSSRCADNETTCRYPTQFEVDDVLAAAQEMGASVVRSNAAVSIGCALCLQGSPGSAGNEATLRHLDYFIMAAAAHRIRLILPLLDNWHYYQGGIHDYANPSTYAINGVAPTTPEWTRFFADPAQIAAFETHIDLILNRVNSYTGVAYRDDPTILAWELGNEIDNVPANWIGAMTTYIKDIDSNHLVAFGQTIGRTGGLSADSLAAPNLDIEDDHFYPPDITRLDAEAAEAVRSNKVFIVGEYNWTTSTLGVWLNAIARRHVVSGDLFWSMQSHRATYGTWDDSVFNGTYPGSTPARQRLFRTLRAHAYAMRGLAAPADSVPGVAPITAIIGNRTAWRGTAVAVDYSVERSTTGPDAGYVVLCDRCATDAGTPWIDASQPGGASWYRVRGYNLSGVAGPYSPVYRVVVDPLNDWHSAALLAHSPGLGFNTTNASLFGNDPSRAFRGVDDTGEYIIWKLAGMASFQAITYFWPNQAASPFGLYTSADGRVWTSAAPTIIVGAGNWRGYTYTLAGLTNTSFVKMVWSSNSGPSWSPQIGRVTLTG